MRSTVRLLPPLALLLLATGIPCEAAPKRASGAPEFAARFYRTYLTLKVEGLPDAGQARRLAPLLSPELRQFFAAARRKQARAEKEHPDEKPPWVEGDLFSSLFERAESFRVGPARIRGRTADVTVYLANRSARPPVHWHDTLILTRGASGWRVSDIRYHGTWQFKPGSSLRSVLASD